MAALGILSGGRCTHNQVVPDLEKTVRPSPATLARNQIPELPKCDRWVVSDSPATDSIASILRFVILSGNCTIHDGFGLSIDSNSRPKSLEVTPIIVP